MQIREKEKSTREYLSLARKVHGLSQRYGIPLIIDDRLDITMAVDAEGVHLGRSDMHIDLARSILGENKIIGATTKTVEQGIPIAGICVVSAIMKAADPKQAAIDLLNININRSAVMLMSHDALSHLRLYIYLKTPATESQADYTRI